MLQWRFNQTIIENMNHNLSIIIYNFISRKNIPLIIHAIKNKFNITIEDIPGDTIIDLIIKHIEFGHPEVAKWLATLDGINIHDEEDYYFKWLCSNGHLQMAQWLESLNGIHFPQ